MAAPVLSFASLKSSIASKKYAPVYFLHGEEGYYIDALVEEFDKILSEDEKVFNQFTLYAPQEDMCKVMELCLRLPMMSERQVVILKEAQAVGARELGKLIPYFSNPSPSTVFVVCCRGKKFEGKEVLKAVKSKGGIVFETPRIYESQVGQLIDGYVRDKGLSCDPKAAAMLSEFIGTNLSRLFNEIDKLATILGKGAMITPEAVERNVGVSKDYNVFELVDAVALRDAPKVFRIAEYFRANPKAVPLVVATSNLFGLFADILTAYYTADKSDAGLSAALGLRNSFALRRFKNAMQRYNPFQVIEIIGALRNFDVKSKGVGSRQNEHDLFRDLLYHILTAPGKIRT